MDCLGKKSKLISIDDYFNYPRILFNFMSYLDSKETYWVSMIYKNIMIINKNFFFLLRLMVNEIKINQIVTNGLESIKNLSN